MRKKLKTWLTKKPGIHPNQAAKQEQMKYAIVLLVIAGVSVGFYSYSSSPPKKTVSSSDAMHFDGVFDAAFNQGSDEALIEKQQQQIDKLTDLVTNRADTNSKAPSNAADESQTKALLLSMQEKLTHLENENKKTHEQLQIALISAQQASQVVRPPSRAEMEARRLERLQSERARYSNAGLETVRFNARKKEIKEERTANNFVWAGTFAEGVLLTGILGDAGINGSKNMGTAMIRLTSGGIMPNEKRSHLEGCFALVSTFGDLSGSSVVLHLQTLSCAGRVINFEQRVYGSVFDLDAMQDLRGTPILKTKPLLSYSAAAGVLAGIGDGLRSYGSVQAVNSNGSYTTISPGALAQSAAGGGLSNPANRISDYVMKIADIYHPLVVAKAGRRVSVLFTKGFWIDKEHQVYESGKAIDEAQKSQVTTTVSHAEGSMESITTSGANDPQVMTPQRMPSNPMQAEQDFMQSQGLSRGPLFSTLQNPEHNP